MVCALLAASLLQAAVSTDESGKEKAEPRNSAPVQIFEAERIPARPEIPGTPLAPRSKGIPPSRTPEALRSQASHLTNSNATDSKPVWQINGAYSQVDLANNTVNISRFCLVREGSVVVVKIGGGSATAFIASESTGQALRYLPGIYDLAVGCYLHTVGDYGTFGSFPWPFTEVLYAERIRDDSALSHPGLPRPKFADAPPTVTKPTIAGTFTGRLLVDLFGTDDDFEIWVNGARVRSYGFSTVGVFEVTQHLRDGLNSLVIKERDNQKGSCWATGYRVGDADSWKAGDAYTRCKPQSSRHDPVYYQAFTVNFVR